MLKNNNNVRIAMLELSDQNKAILEFYFSSAGESLYTVVDEDQADAFIMDFDIPSAKEHLAEIQATNKKPVALLSITEQSIPATVWLEKPLSANALTTAAAKLKELVEEIETQVTAIEEVSEEQDLVISKPIFDESTEKNTADKIKQEDNDDDFESVEEDEKEFSIEAFTQIANATNLVSASNTTKESLGSEDTPYSSDDEGHAFNFDFKSEKEANKEEISSESNNDTENELLTPEVNETEISEDLEVEALLDSLIQEQEQQNATQELEIEEVEIDSTDALLETLSLQADAETENFDKPKSTLNDKDNDALEAVENELLLETLADDEIKLDTSLVDNHSEEEKDNLLVEDFTLHDDTNPSTEDTYANTLEVDFSEVQEKNTLTKESSRTSNIVEDIQLEEVENIDEPEELSSENQLETDMFDFDSLKEEDEPKNLSNEKALEPQELEIEDNTLNDDSLLDADLDELLNEVSFDNNLKPIKQEVQEVQEVSATATETSIKKTTSENDAIPDLDNPSDKELQSLLNEIREEATKKGNVGGSGLTENEANVQTYEKTQAEKRWAQLCGEHGDISSQKELSTITYDTNNHLIDVLFNQIKLNENSDIVLRIKYHDLIIVLDQSKDKIYCNLPTAEDQFTAICLTELNPDDIKIHELDYSEIRLYHKKFKENTDRSHSLESFIWTISLLTSKGRLPADTDINKKVGLKVWPNLTRMELMPHAMQIAAVFSKQPGSLLEISSWLNIEQRYVFAFYNAALALDMIETDSKNLNKSKLSFNAQNTKSEKQERGFFSRLLKRLKS